MSAQTAAIVADVEYLPFKRLAVYSGMCERTLRSYVTHGIDPITWTV